MKTTLTADHRPGQRTRAADTRPKSLFPQETHQRRQRVLKHGTTALVPRIAAAIILKSGDLFFLCESDGRVPLHDRHGLGHYYHDCRFLKGYELKIGGIDPVALAPTADQCYGGLFDHANPVILTADGRLIRKG